MSRDHVLYKHQDMINAFTMFAETEGSGGCIGQQALRSTLVIALITALAVWA